MSEEKFPEEHLDTAQHAADHEAAEVTADELLYQKHVAVGQEMDAIAKKYGLQILYGVNFIGEKRSGVFFVGESNTVIELGLAKAIENKFTNG